MDDKNQNQNLNTNPNLGDQASGLPIVSGIGEAMTADHLTDRPELKEPGLPPLPQTPTETPPPPPSELPGPDLEIETGKDGDLGVKDISMQVKGAGGDVGGVELKIKPKSKRRTGMIVGALLLLLLVIGGGLTVYFLPYLSGDIRQRAASEQVTNADMMKTPEQRAAFAAKWRQFIAAQQEKGVYDFEAYVAFTLGEGARYSPDAVILSNIGTEQNLYGADLNIVFMLHEIEAYTSSEPIGAQNPELNRSLDELITHSGLLQKAAELAIVTLEPTFFDAPNKNQILRINNVKLAREVLGDSLVKRVDFEAIAIYFHNQRDPNIPLLQAKQAAKVKMDGLYERLNRGEITMAQAGDEIANDRIQGDATGISLVDLDPVYYANAYMSILGHEFDEPIFEDESLDEELRSLGDGQMSTVRLFKDLKFEYGVFGGLPIEDKVDSGYMIFKVNKVDFGLLNEFVANSNEEVETKILDTYAEGVQNQLIQ